MANERTIKGEPDNDSTERRPERQAKRSMGEFKRLQKELRTHGRSGLPHMVMGSVAEKTVRLARIPVLTVPLSFEPRRERLRLAKRSAIRQATKLRGAEIRSADKSNIEIARA
jgi:Universal stress protein family